MKKILLFIIAVMMVLSFSVCNADKDNDDSDIITDENEDILGTWTASYNDNKGTFSLSIAGDGTWVMSFKDTANSSTSSNNGTWTRSGNTITLIGTGNFGSKTTCIATLTNNKLTLTLDDWYTNLFRPGFLELTKVGASDVANADATLRIKNESSKILYNVLWNSVLFNDVTDVSIFTGTWTGRYEAKDTPSPGHGAGNVELEIGNNYSIVFRDDDNTVDARTGSINLTGDILRLRTPGSSSWNCGNVSIVNNVMILNLTIEAASSLSDAYPAASRRNIYELTKLGDAFKIGTNVLKDVEAGSGYVYFKVGTVSYRTNDLVIVEKDDSKEFTFTDYSLVIDLNNPGAGAKTLGSL